jgi:hypothetical protein
MFPGLTCSLFPKRANVDQIPVMPDPRVTPDCWPRGRISKVVLCRVVTARATVAASHRQHDNAAELEVTLPAGAGVHSVIFANSTGHIPGFGPRLNPIGNAHDAEGLPRATYMYVDNGSVDGRAEQPFHFRVGKPMMLEDSEGHQVLATSVGFVGRSTLWEYELPDDQS